MISIKTDKLKAAETVVFIANNKWKPFANDFTTDEIKYINKNIKDKKEVIYINKYKALKIIVVLKSNQPEYKTNEKSRLLSFDVCKAVNKEKIKNVVINDCIKNKQYSLAFAEGLILSNYSFDKYFTKDKDENSHIKQIAIKSPDINKRDIDELNNITQAVVISRNLINEPLSELTAVKLSKEIESFGKKAGFTTEVFSKKKIETLKMGGLLAVNRGSVDPPTFSVLEWKPRNAKNKKPVVLVGKGVVFDTGGMNIKPDKSMAFMKCDMAGAAAVVGAMYAITKNKLPVHVIALVPATDNRPGGNAYVPQDIIKMHNGSTVEVLNTDAEGRMILADALSYAKNYKPELVIDIATLTGSAMAAIGHYGIVGMGNAKVKTFEKLKKSGENVYERVVEFPFWDEYNEMLKSDYADIKNIGGKSAGAITAGKFLEHFTDYPYIHLDIAGPAYTFTTDNYRGKGGTGVGVRLLYDLIKNYA